MQISHAHDKISLYIYMRRILAYLGKLIHNAQLIHFLANSDPTTVTNASDRVNEAWFTLEASLSPFPALECYFQFLYKSFFKFRNKNENGIIWLINVQYEVRLLDEWIMSWLSPPEFMQPFEPLWGGSDGRVKAEFWHFEMNPTCACGIHSGSNPPAVGFISPHSHGYFTAEKISDGSFLWLHSNAQHHWNCDTC